jgi:MarR family transcriptional regulator, temperature-dependent positive regulator of motility
MIIIKMSNDMKLPKATTARFIVRSERNLAIPVLRLATPLARRFFQICQAMVADSLAEADLVPLQYGTLHYLNKQTGEPGIDQAGLAARLGVDRNNVGVILAELEARGLVVRRIDSRDQRARRLYLTAKGEKLYQQLLANNLAANERILAPLSLRERELLLDLLIRVIQANAIYARPGAGRRRRVSRPMRRDEG